MIDRSLLAVTRILRPLVRLLITRGVGHAAVSEALKGLYVEQGDLHFRLGEKRMTESRLSLLTGLRRREVKRLREEPLLDGPATMGPAARVVALWAGAPAWRDEHGVPFTLLRRGETGQTFEVLVGAVSRDIHPRSVLDVLVEEGAVLWDQTVDEITLVSPEYIPKSDNALLDYVSMNLGDHAEAAVANTLSSDTPPFFERAAHFNQLTPQSLAELDAVAREAQSAALQQVAIRAGALQSRDAGDRAATGRFRSGGFVFWTSKADDTAKDIE